MQSDNRFRGEWKRRNESINQIAVIVMSPAGQMKLTERGWKLYSHAITQQSDTFSAARNLERVLGP